MAEPLKILIVDDAPEDRATFRRYLTQDKNRKYELLESESGDDGLRLCREKHPDCVLLDYNLPDLDGLDFLTRLNTENHQPYFAVIMLTGQGNEAVAVEAMKAGAQDYLVKGRIEPHDFRRAIENAVEKVSLLRALEEHRRELERSNKELEQFAYIASHDLQAPLRRTVSFCELLQNRYQGQLDKEAKEFIGYIVESTKQMQALISGLLDYARVGMRTKPFAPTDMARVVDEVFAYFENAIRESGATMTRDGLLTITADRVQMVQLLQNLVGNALKYRGDREPVVHVSAQERGDEVEFSVQDNGIGIDRKHLEEIFAIFKRLHGDSQYSGSGIGLATCKKIVERHGGRIWVESEPDQGSVFRFTIPKLAEAAP